MSPVITTSSILLLFKHSKIVLIRRFFKFSSSACFPNFLTAASISESTASLSGSKGSLSELTRGRSELVFSGFPLTKM